MSRQVDIGNVREWLEKEKSAAVVQCEGVPAENVDANEQSARHSPDFRSVHWFGTDYEFSKAHAACVEVLWMAWENGTPTVCNKTVVASADVVSDRLDLVFRGNPAWGAM